MSYKVDESKLMSYLYGELSEEESKKVASYLEENEAAREELEQMSQTQGILGKVKDREVEVPNFVFNDTSPVIVPRTSNHFTFWKKSLAIAASVTLLMLVGYFTKFNFNVNGDGVQIAFGDQAVTNELNQQEVSKLIEQALVKNNEHINGMIKNSESEVRQLVSQGTTTGDEQLESYMEQLRLQNIETLTGLLEASELGQKNYTEDLIREFAIYLDVQRQNDMQVIQARFDNMLDDAHIDRMQTNRILSNLLQTPEEPSNQY